MSNEPENQPVHHVVIVGGGFGGLYAAHHLRKAPVKVTLIDKRNFHLFQPLLYQVATGGLSPADIASPLRAVLSPNKNTKVLMGSVTDINPQQQTVQLRDAKAKASLERLGVTVQTNTLVTNLEDNLVTIRQGDRTEQIPARTILWAAGMKASGMGEVLAQRTGVECDRAGRVIVQPDLSLPDYPNIFVIGDLANFPHQYEDGKPLPGVAPVAMQEGDYVARLIQKRLKGETLPAFHYTNYGSLAVIGRNAAVVDLGFVKFSGFFAWLAWIFVHIFFLIEFDNKLLVMIQWAWNYFTRKRGARLITHQEEAPFLGVETQVDDRTAVKV